MESLAAGRGRILVSRLQYLGDVILTLPLVAALKERFPSCDIDYLTRPDGAALLAGDPRFGRVFKAPASGGGPLASLKLIRRLRQRRYRLAIDLYSNPRSALLVWASGAPVRLGGARRLRRRLFSHNVTVPKTVRSALEHHLYYLKQLGIETAAARPELLLAESERKDGAGLLAGKADTESPLKIGLHPGGKWPVKRWPVDYFAALARLLRRNLKAAIYVFQGAGEDQVFSQQLMKLLRYEAVLLPQLPIRQAAAVMSALDAGIYCDGGAMHLSVAVGTPTVGIFGSSEPDIWFPYEPFGPYRAAWLPQDCRPCHQHDCDHLKCLTGLEAESVERVVREVLEHAREHPAEGGVRNG
jgi:lipopolysaccharide heptosyltransferase II